MENSSAAGGEGEAHRNEKKELAALLTRIDHLETFLSLKFPSWRDEVGALAPNSSTKDNKAPTWVLSGSSKNGTLSGDGMTLTKTGGGRTGWDCNVLGTIGWTTGIHEFSIRLESSCEMMVGVAPAQTNPVGPNWSTCGFYLGTHSGALFGQDGTWKREYLFRRCSKKGTVVHVRLDCDRRCLWFAAEGADFPAQPAFTNLPALPLYPSFDLDNKGSSFTLLDRKFTPTMTKKA